ncbi:MAG: DUF2284 domain-containing protein [Eubacteriaceae bacterium]|jgi:predicted metal-binding protein
MSLTEYDLKKRLEQNYPHLQLSPIDPDQLIFEERVKVNCFYCPDYNLCLTCPGHLPNKLDLPKAIHESNHALFVWKTYEITDDNKASIFRESGREIHHALLDLETILMAENCPMALSFLAGRCRLCDECPTDGPCRNPGKARISLDATSCNVVKSASQAGISIDFADHSHFKRIGLICW